MYVLFFIAHFNNYNYDVCIEHHDGFVCNCYVESVFPSSVHYSFCIVLKSINKVI